MVWVIDNLVDGMRLCVQDVIRANVQSELAAAGVRIVTTPAGFGGGASLVSMPNSACLRRCTALYVGPLGLCCQRCAAKERKTPPRPLVEDYKRIRVGRVLATYGKPAWDDSAAVHVCRISNALRFVMLPSTQCLGGVRWWFPCPGCQKRCGVLYRPASGRKLALRCRRCWNLGYRSQRI